MDIRELRYFAAVYRERNPTAAAKRCFISQPGQEYLAVQRWEDML